VNKAIIDHDTKISFEHVHSIIRLLVNFERSLFNKPVSALLKILRIHMW